MTTLTVKYFALLREALDRNEERVEIPDTVTTVGALRQWLMDLDEQHQTAFTQVTRIRAAVNGELVDDDEASIVDAHEVAFFPPVTGG